MPAGEVLKRSSVYFVLANLGMDSTTLAAALLHDTVEDCEYPLETVQAIEAAAPGHVEADLVAGPERPGRPRRRPDLVVDARPHRTDGAHRDRRGPAAASRCRRQLAAAE